MKADEVFWPCDPLGEAGDRQRRGVGAEQSIVGDDLLDPTEGLVLQLLVLEDRLDDEVSALGQIERVGRGDAGEHLIASGLGHLAPRDGLVQDSL